MKQETITEGASVEEAVEAALEELGASQEDVDYEILDEPGKRLFGLAGEKPARVRMWLKAAEPTLEDEEVEEEVEPEVLPAEVVGEAGAGVEQEELTDEELDQVADVATSVLTEVLAGFGVTANIEEYEGDVGEIILDIVGDDLGILIGRHGKTLDALQTVVAAITNRKAPFRYPILVDVAGYRYRRKAKLEEIAKRAADRAARQGRPVKLRPMSSYERKVVHMALRDDRRVMTASEGEEPFRQVVVGPKQR